MTAAELKLFQQALANKQALDASNANAASSSLHADNVSIAQQLEALGYDASAIEADNASELAAYIATNSGIPATGTNGGGLEFGSGNTIYWTANN